MRLRLSVVLLVDVLLLCALCDLLLAYVQGQIWMDRIFESWSRNPRYPKSPKSKTKTKGASFLDWPHTLRRT
jgi:hypothetical protein